MQHPGTRSADPQRTSDTRGREHAHDVAMCGYTFFENALEHFY